MPRTAVALLAGAVAVAVYAIALTGCAAQAER